MAQRLIPIICEDCKTKRPITKGEKTILSQGLGADSVPKEVWYGEGCDKCLNTGYYSRMPVFEYWKKTDNVQSVIVNKGTQSDLLGAVKLQNFRSLYQFALQMVLNGLTTAEQVNKYLYQIDMEKDIEDFD